jgi:PhzF family phenazine biosynthesis protein
MTIKVHTINAFSIGNTGGNPAGVVFDADNLSSAEKQVIAASAGFPETAFVSASTLAAYKLDFYTPTKQIPHCGHATIATFSYMKLNGGIKGDHSSKETIDGCRDIFFEGGLAYMEQTAPRLEVPAGDLPLILDSLGINESDLMPGQLPTIVNTGNSFLVVPLKSELVLQAIAYDREAVYRLSEKYGLIGFYVYAIPQAGGFDATTRMFAPFYGIDEEAATGMAAGPLAAFLYKIAGIKKTKFQIEQGRYMQPASPSLIRVKLMVSADGITKIFAGGEAYVAAEKTIELDKEGASLPA